MYRSIVVGALGRKEYCDRCAGTMVWLPQVGRMEAGGGPGGFDPFTTEVLQPDGSHKTVVVSTLSDIRRLERETEVRARNGEGQAMRWRDYSQDHSNQHTHLFGESPALTPSKEALAKFGPAITRHGETEPEAALGPSVTEADASVFADV